MHKKLKVGLIGLGGIMKAACCRAEPLPILFPSRASI